jgi:biotin carboxyl carrier protein
LKEYNFLVNGKRHIVRLLRNEKRAQFLVEVDGKTSQLKLKEKFRYGSQFPLEIADKSYTVQLNKINKNLSQFSIKINGKKYTVQPETAKTILAHALKPSLLIPEKKAARKAVAEKGEVTAPMPGKIVVLRVKVGDLVRVGDPLCVLEAMKMENEITASKTGTIKEIRVSEGSTVNNGDALITID